MKSDYLDHLRWQIAEAERAAERERCQRSIENLPLYGWTVVILTQVAIVAMWASGDYGMSIPVAQIMLAPGFIAFYVWNYRRIMGRRHGGR